MISASRMRRRLPGALLAALLAAAPSPAAAGVSVALLPAHPVVAPDSTFALDLDVTQAGSAFNGFHAVIGYDPAAIAFVQLSPLSLQEGCLMTGACSGACGTTYSRFTAAGDSLVIDESLLCNSYSLTGPGQIYTLRFTAGSTQQTTYVRVRRIAFYQAGVAVTPVTSADAQVDIHTTSGVAPGASVAGLRLSVMPNPARGPVSLAIEAGAPGEQLVDVLDLAGRRVRALERAWRPAGARVLAWDGAGEDGGRLPAGVYLVRVRAGEREVRARVVLLR